jgi:hypothetical protein
MKREIQMKKLLVATTIASLVLAAPAARADEWGGLVGGLAGGLIAGAIASSMQPHTIYVPVERRHHVAPRPRAPAPTRVVVVHDRPVVNTVVAPVPVAVPVPVAAAAPANNNNIVMTPAPAPAPIIINNSPAPAPAPIIINTTPAAPAAPTSAVADRCQQNFQKTADYLACLKGIAPVAAN